MPIVAPLQRRPLEADPATSRSSLRASPDGWSALGLIGAAFLLLGLLDIALGWYPTAFGNLEWEFGTISGSLNALAIPMLGVYLMLASAVARGDRRMGRMVAVIMGVLLITLLALGVVYLTVVPVALKSVASNALVALGMKKAVVKALSLGVVDVALLSVGLRKGWRVGSRP
jgi:hypothetical protein